MKHFTKQYSSLCILHGTIGIQENNIVYTSKQKHYQFSSKNPSATKNSSKSNVYYMVVASDKRGSLVLVGSLSRRRKILIPNKSSNG